MSPLKSNFKPLKEKNCELKMILQFQECFRILILTLGFIVENSAHPFLCLKQVSTQYTGNSFTTFHPLSKQNLYTSEHRFLKPKCNAGAKLCNRKASKYTTLRSNIVMFYIRSLNVILRSIQAMRSHFNKLLSGSQCNASNLDPNEWKSNIDYFYLQPVTFDLIIKYLVSKQHTQHISHIKISQKTEYK